MVGGVQERLSKSFSLPSGAESNFGKGKLSSRVIKCQSPVLEME